MRVSPAKSGVFWNEMVSALSGTGRISCLFYIFEYTKLYLVIVINMQNYIRLLKNNITSLLRQWKTIILYGPRQVGKTTLIKEIIKKHKDNTVVINGDVLPQHDLIAFANGVSISWLLKNKKLLFIDEAQRIENIGLHIKVLHDSDRKGQIIATWSSSFDLANKISEPLTWRIVQFMMYPLSVQELIDHDGIVQVRSSWEQYLTYGTYPEVITWSAWNTRSYLENLTSNYLYKDVLHFDKVNKSQTLIKLLQLLALQIWQEVSYQELWQQLGIHLQTVERYIDLLEKSFVIFRLPAYSTNKRKEISKWKKIYFIDLGIRNALLQAFNPLSLRQDVWAVRENFVIMERVKALEYAGISSHQYFWRSRSQQEIDYLEEINQSLFAYEIKRNIKKARIKTPSQFKKTYPDIPFECISQDSFVEWLGRVEAGEY